MNQLKRPDYPIDFFSLNRLKPMLQSEGVVLLRKVLSPNRLNFWRERFVEAWQATEARLLAGEMTESELLNYYRFGHPMLRFLPDLNDWLDLLFGQIAMKNILRTLIGPQVLVMGSVALPRIVFAQHSERALPYHQDYEYIGPVKQAVNLWIPLSAAGGQHPGLELWQGSPQEAQLVHGQPEEVRQAILAQAPAEAWWQPEMKPGDILIFTTYTVHRTYITPEMSGERVSYELRVCPESDRQFTQSAMLERRV